MLKKIPLGIGMLGMILVAPTARAGWDAECQRCRETAYDVWNNCYNQAGLGFGPCSKNCDDSNAVQPDCSNACYADEVNEQTRCNDQHDEDDNYCWVTYCS